MKAKYKYSGLDKIRYAIVGIGSRGHDLLRRSLGMADVECVALCDPILSKAQWCKQHYKLDIPIFSSLEEVLESVGVDAIIIGAGDSYHADIAVPALQAGKYVFCEKPMDITLEKCQEIVAADEAAGGKTFIGFNLRYAPTYARIRAELDKGVIGDILTIQADEFYSSGRTYFRRWNRLREMSGGLWITKASHDFDLLNWFAGVEPLQVYATATRSYYVPKAEAAGQCRDCQLAESCPDRAPKDLPPLVKLTEEATGHPGDLCLFNSDTDTFDHGIATITFANGIMATYTCNVVASFSGRRIRISGTKGTLDGSLSGDRLILYRRDHTISKEEISLNADTGEGHGGADEVVIKDFFEFVRGNAEPKCRPREAILPVAMGLAATLSSDENRVVDMKDFALGEIEMEVAGLFDRP